MKTKFNITLLMLLFIGLTSCEDYLEVNPEFGLSEDVVFSDYISLRAYLDNCYVVLNDELNWTSQNRSQGDAIYALSDEAGSLQNNSSIVEFLNTGAWTNHDDVPEIGWKNPNNRLWRAPIFNNASYAIRITNKVLEALENDITANLSQDEKDELAGQAYFLRAWYYFEMIRRFGGLPLLDKAYAGDDDVDLVRKTYSESSEWLISGLDQAIALLPHRWEDIQAGRATKGSALALKSMAALYAASPLMQNDTNSTQYLDYSQSWAERAAEYANNTIKYVASGVGGSGPSNYRLMNGSEYKNIFYHEEVNISDESLWYRFDISHSNHNRKSIQQLYLPRRLAGGDARFTNPTQNIVDMFEVINNGNAYSIHDSRSGYDPQNPFVNRDPRFYNNILYPGEEWSVARNGNKTYQELYVDGTDYIETSTNNNTNARDISGYVCKKYIWPEATDGPRQWELNTFNTIYIRVAQVYLDYAEAMNEAYGPTADPKGYGLTAVQAINIVRNRVGMPDVLPEFTSSKTAFQDKIRNERAVELMWENHRWFDLRRWMIAEDVLSKPIRGVRAIPPTGHESVTDKSTLNFTYEYYNAPSEQRVFNLRHYWYPMPLTDVQDLFNYKQNPGW
ncbi:RagB/SusD family nutrient uptake outer membrane protein [Algibacter amylolyticus]|uniref:RagB/SusD family nutrient uptake outer membrane protein n=1 Tax=Algibacter amylolyticus TaxID=1608400 RepID=A0A5M7B8V1_9FLAO|nr:RagB/SusD family nutrient uptake outer membrane protein [Algibacter amylolyticus]KAA5825130.1 RagB/SusD family nutrient uptake outer membrane protein [Algibacter amylolyticus]MBB5268762.1 hypothetical protein [Algibacter amylolyticus]TSJ77624.1 RagB/SusD family nutrient uptake outer membrane protein [Algibacter amylolyticus]